MAVSAKTGGRQSTLSLLARWVPRLGAATAVVALLGVRAGPAAEQTPRRYVCTQRGEKPRPVVAVDNVCAWPNLTVLRDGTITAVIYNRPCHACMVGDVECWASSDQGRTWEKRGVPAAHEPPNSNRMGVVVWDPSKSQP